jgi:hypothetical protein
MMKKSDWAITKTTTKVPRRYINVPVLKSPVLILPPESYLSAAFAFLLQRLSTIEITIIMATVRVKSTRTVRITAAKKIKP